MLPITPSRKSAASELQSTRFRQARESDWLTLDVIVERALRRGLASLSEHELLQLPSLYRAALSSLGVARAAYVDSTLISYLEALTARAYLVIYASRRTLKAPVRTFMSALFPQALRQIKLDVLLSCMFFGLGIAVSLLMTLHDLSWFDAFVDPALAGGRGPSASVAELKEVLYQKQSANLTLFASFLFSHNARIGMLCVALGIAAGVPTALLLFQNGLMLGAFIGLHVHKGLLLPLLGWLLPHGVPEIAALLFCGAAGIHLGRAVVFPGVYRVRDALIRAGRTSAMVVAGCVLLFAVAGLVEGIFRQTVRKDEVRFAVATFNALWLTLWIGWRTKAQNPEGF